MCKSDSNLLCVWSTVLISSQGFPSITIPSVAPQAPAINENHRPSPDWPPRGHVKFDHYSTRYREGLDLVLKDISVDVPGGTKVAYPAY